MDEVDPQMRSIAPDGALGHLGVSCSVRAWALTVAHSVHVAHRGIEEQDVVHSSKPGTRPPVDLYTPDG